MADKEKKPAGRTLQPGVLPNPYDFIAGEYAKPEPVVEPEVQAPKPLVGKWLCR